MWVYSYFLAYSMCYNLEEGIDLCVVVESLSVIISNIRGRSVSKIFLIAICPAFAHLISMNNIEMLTRKLRK